MLPIEIFQIAVQNMEKSVKHASRELQSLNIGKATPTLVENLPISVYNSKVTLKEIAAIVTLNDRTISIQPWDKQLIKSVEKSLMKYNLGFMPKAVDDKILCTLPYPSRERRKELAKICRAHAERAKVGVRSARRYAIESMKKANKNSIISEDELKRYENKIQVETNTHIAIIDELLKKKEILLL